MSHLPSSLMNRLNKTESAFQSLDAAFPKDPLARLLEVVWRNAQKSDHLVT